MWNVIFGIPFPGKTFHETAQDNGWTHCDQFLTTTQGANLRRFSTDFSTYYNGEYAVRGYGEQADYIIWEFNNDRWIYYWHPTDSYMPGYTASIPIDICIFNEGDGIRGEFRFPTAPQYTQSTDVFPENLQNSSTDTYYLCFGSPHAWTSGTTYTRYDVYGTIGALDSDGDGIPDDEDSCPLEDATGFDVNGDGCIDSISGLTTIVEILVDEGVIDEQMQNSLLSKIDNASQSADKENICAAVNQLEALINQVNAQRGKKISDEAADQVIAYAQSVIGFNLDQLPEGETCL